MPTRSSSSQAPATVLVLAGTSYCGSTLVSLLANAHPEMTSIGELTGPTLWGRKAIAEYICSCEKRLPECRLWRSVFRETAANGIDFGPHRWDAAFALAPDHRALNFALSRSLRSNALDALRDAAVTAVPSLRRRIEEVSHRNALVIRAILRDRGARVFVDASKDPLRARWLGAIPGVDVRLVHLVRDAPAFVHSDMRHWQRPPMPGIRAWNRTAANVTRIAAQFAPDRFLRVRYEDLCRDPETWMNRIATLADAEPLAGPFRLDGIEHHVIGNRMRRGFARIAIDERWRTELEEDELRLISRRTRRWRRAFGYCDAVA